MNNQMPNFYPGYSGGMMPNQMPNQMPNWNNPNSCQCKEQLNTIDNKINRIERQLRRLEERVNRIENSLVTPLKGTYQDYGNNDSNMYMM